MQPQLRTRVLLSATFAAITAIMTGGQFAPSRAAETPDGAKGAEAIFQKNCVNCHGNTQPPKGVNLTKRETLIITGAVKPKDAAHSRLIDVVQSGFMPLGGKKLSDADIGTLRDWINAGAQDWAPPSSATAPVRKTISEGAILNAIRQDLDTAPERSRPYLRYYSLANNYNNQDTAEVTTEDLKLYHTSLGKLLNSLSWNPDIVIPKTLGPDGMLLRIDLRDLDWTPEIWQRIIAAYPFGFRGFDLSEPLADIQALSGVRVPYIRVDWFVANASVPPLYHDILQLPNNLADLERKLGVNDELDVQEEKVIRAGLRDSGVSHNNRAVERHRSLYGAFWRSFDFASNEGDKNIFKNPVDITPDGGEFIFNLPNGLQGYLVANGKGERLDDAPIKIVRDRTNLDDPVVHNGRSCIGCHFQGMNRFHDEVRPALDTNPHGAYDLEKALALYGGQEKLDSNFDSDAQRFLRAVQATGSQPPGKPDDEPISRLARRYALDLTLSQAAADTGLSISEFRQRVAASPELQRLGFAQLLEPNGGFKRDAWEADFGALVGEIHLGDYIQPTLPGGPMTSPAPIQPLFIRINHSDNAGMILIPGGPFVMGGAGQNDNPPRIITLDSYYIYKNLVTVAQYQKFCKATGRPLPPAPDWGWKIDHPMVNVNWEDAKAYADWAGAELPTEAQWEKAARGTDGRTYPWGNQWDSSRLWCSKAKPGDAGSTAPIGSYPRGASPYGVLDMAGNVWEWCADWYSGDYYRTALAVNPAGPTSGMIRVMRGSSWFIDDEYGFRSASRGNHDPMGRGIGFGFRCVVRAGR